MIGMGEKVCRELVGIPYRTFFEIALDRMPVDIGKIPFLYIPVEDPHAHIDTETVAPA